jgi:hypothetical protein
MSYPDELKKHALELTKKHSCEKVASLLSQEVLKGQHNFAPDARTIRNWKTKESTTSAPLNIQQVKESKKHDIRIFTLSNDILSEEDVRYVFLQLQYPPYEYRVEINEKFERFQYYFNLVGNQYNILEIRKLCISFSKQLCKIGEYMSPHYYARGSYTKFLPNVSPPVNDWELENSPQYQQMGATLSNLAIKTLRSFQRYRAAVSQILSV